MQLVEVVCCKMTDLQRQVYNHFVESKVAARMLNQGKGGTKVLGAITALKKLCNHPKLVYDALNSKGAGMDGFESCSQFFPPGAASRLFAVLYAHISMLWGMCVCVWGGGGGVDASSPASVNSAAVHLEVYA